MAIPRTQPFQSLQTQRGNPQLQQLLQLIAAQSQRRPASGPPTALPTPFRQGINRAPLPPAQVNPLNALDQAQRGIGAGAIPPGLLPGLPPGPQFVPGSAANVKGNFQSPNRAPGSVFSDITAGGVGPGTPGIPNPVANPLPISAPQVNRRSGPSPAAGAAAARGLQGFQLPGQQLKRIDQVASKNSGENIVTTTKGDVGPDQAKRIQDTAKQSAGVPKSAKNAPAWALPLMMMGLTMAASKRTDSLGAFSEGGLAGLQLFMQQKSTKRKAATEERKLRVAEEKARAATTTARASTVTAEAAKSRAESASAEALGSIGKRARDMRSLFAGPNGAEFRKLISRDEEVRIIAKTPDRAFKVMVELLKAQLTLSFGEPLKSDQIRGAVDNALEASGLLEERRAGPTAASPGPAAVTGSVTQIQRQGGRLVAQ